MFKELSICQFSDNPRRSFLFQTRDVLQYNGNWICIYQKPWIHHVLGRQKHHLLQPGDKSSACPSKRLHHISVERNDKEIGVVVVPRVTQNIWVFANDFEVWGWSWAITDEWK
jgi:hypothetical protein